MLIYSFSDIMNYVIVICKNKTDWFGVRVNPFPQHHWEEHSTEHMRKSESAASVSVSLKMSDPTPPYSVWYFNIRIHGKHKLNKFEVKTLLGVFDWLLQGPQYIGIF